MENLKKKKKKKIIIFFGKICLTNKHWSSYHKTVIKI